MFPMVLFGVILDHFVCITKILLKLEIVEIKKCQILQKNMTNICKCVNSEKQEDVLYFPLAVFPLLSPWKAFPFNVSRGTD